MSSPSERLSKLLAMLETQPADPFLLYGVALEYKKSNDTRRAIEYLNRTITTDPAYSYAYFQKGQVLEMQGNLDAARQIYREGMAAATKAGDDHARSEIESALQMIE